MVVDSGLFMEALGCGADGIYEYELPVFFYLNNPGNFYRNFVLFSSTELLGELNFGATLNIDI